MCAIVVTKEEAKIAGVAYNEPFILAEFLISKEYPKVLLLSRGGGDAPFTSNLLHVLAAEFCEKRKRHCSNREFFIVLDKCIEMCADIFNDRVRNLTEIVLENGHDRSGEQTSRTSRRKMTGSEWQEKCNVKELHDAPSPREFYNFVKQSQPFIIRAPPSPPPSEMPRRDDAVTYSNAANAGELLSSESTSSPNELKQNDKLWSLKNLTLMFGNASVVVNASPTSDFDGVSNLTSVLKELFICVFILLLFINYPM
jgi:hypothetical protein